MKKYTIPTGYLFVDEYSKGELETLSIGDYGKHYNVKAEFLGFNKDILGVPNTHCMPLSEKWVVTVSTQYGCIEKCNFCDVPNIGYKGNATLEDMYSQLKKALSLFPTVKYTERLNLHFARMGEPSYNRDCYLFAEFILAHKYEIQKETGVRVEVFHPVFTTMCPKNHNNLDYEIQIWANLKNYGFRGQAGIQLSINSTNEDQRREMFGDRAVTLEEVSRIGKLLSDPLSRKYCLNFALASNYEVNAEKLRDLFDPEKFMVKITPIHNNNACRKNGIETTGGYDSFHPYMRAETDLKKVGFDVLIFVPSMDEEDGLVTCGNLILGGGKLKCDEGVVKIMGV